MIPESVKLAIKTAIDASPVSAIVTPVDSELEPITIAKCGFGGMSVETEGVNGRMIRVQRHDARSLIVWPDDLMVGNQRYEPVNGDAWQITLPSGEIVLGECAPIEPESHWRWTDRFQTARRIHIKIQNQ